MIQPTQSQSLSPTHLQKSLNKNMLKIGIIGPTNIQKLSLLTNKSQEFFLEKAKLIGKILAENNCELWVNSDKGMLVAIGRAYKQYGGKKLVILYPEKGEPWPKEHAKPYIKNSDVLRMEKNWFWSNYNVVTIPDFCICVGFSAGTLSELAYIKWNYQFKCGNLKKLIGIKELIRGNAFPAEMEIGVEDIIQYCDKTEDLEKILGGDIQRLIK